MHKAYIAGVIDCDGAIMMTVNWKKYPRIVPEVVISTSDEEYARKLAEAVEGYVSKRRQPNGHLIYRVQVSNQRRVMKLLQSVMPYLILKRREAEIVCEFCRSRQQHRRMPYTFHEKQLVKRLFELHHKGPRVNERTWKWLEQAPKIR